MNMSPRLRAMRHILRGHDYLDLLDNTPWWRFRERKEYKAALDGHIGAAAVLLGYVWSIDGWFRLEGNAWLRVA